MKPSEVLGLCLSVLSLSLLVPICCCQDTDTMSKKPKQSFHAVPMPSPEEIAADAALKTVTMPTDEEFLAHLDVKGLDDVLSSLRQSFIELALRTQKLQWQLDQKAAGH